MTTFKTTLLAIIFTLPFLFADLYTKYLAHTELPNEGDHIVLIEPLYAISPMINYGGIFEDELKKENARHWEHLVYIPIIILAAWLAYHAVGSGFLAILYFMFLGGALGNGIEVAMFSGGTDFLNTNTGTLSFDRFVFNLADVFIWIPCLVCIIHSVFLLVYHICRFYIYDKILLPIKEKLIWRLCVKLGIMEEYIPAPPKYYEELTLEVVRRYKAGETLEEIATALDKTPNSIRGKLVSEKVYTEYKDVNFRLSQMTNAEIEPLNLTEGMEYSFDDATQYLNEAGYIRVSQVNDEGYYSVKGGMIKVHPFGSEEAITLDYFGDTIETIKVVSKQSNLTSVSIPPYMAEQENDAVEPEDQEIEQIELTAPNVEEAIKLVLDHWVKIFNIYKDGFPLLLDPKIDFETGLEYGLSIQFESGVDEEGVFFNIWPTGDLYEEIQEKEAIFNEKDLGGVRAEELPRSFMDKILNRPQTYRSYPVQGSTKSFNFGHVDLAEITTDVMRLVKAMVEVFPEYLGDDQIKLVSVDASDVDHSFPDSELPLLKNIDVTILKS